MSNRITHVEAIGKHTLRIAPASLQEIEDVINLPESNFVEAHSGTHPDEHGDVHLRNIWWHGEGSDEEDLQIALSYTRGEADIVVTYESGHLSGIQVRDGKVTECDVKRVLVPKAGR